MTRPAAEVASLLEAEREELLEERRRIEEHISSQPQSEETGELRDHLHHPADAASATYDREQQAALLENVEGLLRKVNRALEKIREGSYGICDRCGGEIAPPRLEALPSACLCLDCQDREDLL